MSILSSFVALRTNVVRVPDWRVVRFGLVYPAIGTLESMVAGLACSRDRQGFQHTLAESWVELLLVTQLGSYLYVCM